MSIDPKIRARRVAVKRAEGRRRLRYLLILLVLVALVAAGWMATRSALLDVDRFEVNGLSVHSQGDVLAELNVEIGTPLLDVDLGAIDTRVEALPWVKEARTARQWPGTLRIDVVERVPMALIPSRPGYYALVDESGVVTSESALAGAPDLPIVDVAFDTELGLVEKAALPGLAVIEVMPSDLLPWIRRVIVDPQTSKVGLDLVGGAQVELGEVSLLADKLDAVRSILAGADLTCVALIDATVADLPTITRDTECDGGDENSSGTKASG